MTEATSKSKKITTDVFGNKLPCELYTDGYLRSNMEEMRSLVENNWDVIGFIVGYEGDGKTALAMQICLGLDHTFNIDNIVFNPDQFSEAVDNAKPKTTILWDESDSLGGKWWDDMLIGIKKKFKRIRKKNLFIFLVTPTIFDLDKYFVIHRTRFLIHVYSEGKKRGFFRFFNREGKKHLYLKGKKTYDMKSANPSFYGRFTDYPKNFPINLQEYEKKKDAATKAILKTSSENKRQAIADYRRKSIKRFLKWADKTIGKKPSQTDTGYVFGIDRSMVSKDLSHEENTW